MPFYKDKEEKIHFLEAKKDLNLLPKGSVEITKEEIQIINKASIIIKKTGAIKLEAQKRIIALVPDKFGISNSLIIEMNMLMHVSYLLNKKIDLKASTSELKEISGLIPIKETIDAIRQASKDMIVDMETDIDPAAYNVETNTLWP